MKAAIVGMGLIGGSFARAFKAMTDWEVYAENRSRDVLKRAEEAGAIDGELTPEILSQCELIIVALYPQRLIEWLEKNAESISKNAVVTDTCGVKQAVCEPCRKIAEKYGFTFIGAHPMAGVEHSGFDHSKADMFQNASMILVPNENTPEQKVKWLESVSREVGFSKIVITTPFEHDRMIAFTSQLAHVVSSAYVQSPCALNHKGFSAGSYRDMTRVATLNEDMWTELFLDNSETLADQVDELVDMLKKYGDAIRSKNAPVLKELLRNGRIRKEQADGKYLK